MAAPSYEAMIVYSLKAGEEALNANKEKFAKLIAKNGEILETKEWGKRLLRYEIQKQREG